MSWGRTTSGQSRRRRGVSFVVVLALVAAGLGVVPAAPASADSSAPGAWAWGWNALGQLGDGTTTNRLTPVRVAGLTGVTAITAGQFHSLALRADGTVWAWGQNDYGQLGDGTTTNRLTPVRVAGLTGVTAITAGYFHSLALRSDGTVWAWGGNYWGQLGNGTTTDGHALVEVTDLTNITAISAGSSHSLALRSDGTVSAWGDNRSCQLADGTCTGRLQPVGVVGVTAVAAVRAGGDHSLALRSDGTVSAWGDNRFGQLGTGTAGHPSTPAPVATLAGVTAIAAGATHSLALHSDGTVWAWGYNRYGALGDGTTAERHTPVQVAGLTGVTAIAAGLTHSLAIAGGPPPGSTFGGYGRRFDDWHAGDVHVHAAGDSGLTGHIRCGDLARGDEAGCADRLVSDTQGRAVANGLEWLIYTEHAPFLGLRVPLSACVGGVCAALPTGWDAKQARRQYGQIKEAARGRAPRSSLRLLMGEEMGTAAAMCKALQRNAGHFGVYWLQHLLDNTAWDCDEGHFLAEVSATGAWGAVNHPDNGDGGSDWHCWRADDVQPGFPDVEWPCSSAAFDLRGEGFRAIEAVSDNHLPSTATLDTIDGLLQTGAVVALTGGTDSHTSKRTKMDFEHVAGARQSAGNDAKIGLTGRTFAFSPGSMAPGNSFDPMSASDPARRAILDGHTIASNGPLVVPSVRGALPGDTVGLDGATVGVRIDWAGSFRVLSGSAEVGPGTPVPTRDVTGAPDKTTWSRARCGAAMRRAPRARAASRRTPRPPWT